MHDEGGGEVAQGGGHLAGGRHPRSWATDQKWFTQNAGTRNLACRPWLASLRVCPKLDCGCFCRWVGSKQFEDFRGFPATGLRATLSLGSEGTRVGLDGQK